jgi:hypothetical protein
MKFERFFGFAAVVLVAVGLALAFLFLGTPGNARVVALDHKRVDDLQQMAVDLHDRYGYSGGVLPATLPAAVAKNDPATNTPYEFRRLNGKTYVLCATFGGNASEDDGEDQGLSYRRDWKHGPGRTCYKVNVARGAIDPQRVKG